MQNCIVAAIHKKISSLKSMNNTLLRYKKIDTNPVKDATMPKLRNAEWSRNVDKYFLKQEKAYKALNWLFEQ